MNRYSMDIGTTPRVVIHDRTRTDRDEIMYSEMDKFFGSQTTVMDAVTKKGFSGITESHQNCIRLAKESNWDHVLIMEDDVRFFPNSRSCADRAFANVPDKQGWDVLLGGCYSMQHGITRPYWRHAGIFSGAHFYVIRNDAYDRALQIKTNKWNQYDKCLGEILSCWTAWPMFAIQHNGYSDNVKKVTDYDHLLRKFNICYKF